MKIKTQAHVAYQTQYHGVWIPKRRRKILIDGVKEYLEKTIYSNIESRYPDVYVSEMNIQPDHVHALIEIPPKYSVSTVIGYIKGITSRLMRMHFEYLRQVSHLWADGFFVSTVGINERVIKRYIQFQDKQERGQVELASIVLIRSNTGLRTPQRLRFWLPQSYGDYGNRFMIYPSRLR